MESFNGKFRDELLNGELFLGLEDARWVIDRWRLDYNTGDGMVLSITRPRPRSRPAVFWRIPLRFILQNTELPLTRNSLIRTGTRLGGRSWQVCA